MNVQIPPRSEPSGRPASDAFDRRFTVLLSPTRRGARLARRLTERQLADWEQPSEAAQQIVAELVANAIQHGRVPGRDFRLTLATADGVLRIEVTDAWAERLPVPQARTAPPDGEREGGRGLLIVEALADSWGVDISPEPPVRKTVWATLEPVAPPSPLARRP